MKRSLPSLIAGTLLVVILLLYMITFQVSFQQVAVKYTFGSATKDDVIKEPGLYWKWPWPIQRVVPFDSRKQTTVTVGEETQTRDGMNVIISTMAIWKVNNPHTLSVRYGDMHEARLQLNNLIRTAQKAVLGEYAFSSLLSVDQGNPDRDQLKYDQIERDILASIQAKIAESFGDGLEVEMVGIERLGLPAVISGNVFEAMKKERQAEAQRYISTGEASAQTIKDTAEGIARTIMAFADRRAAEIVAKGQERAAGYNTVFQKNTDLALFLLKLDKLKDSLSSRATVIFGADTEPYDLLKEKDDGASEKDSDAEGGAAALLPPLEDIRVK